MTSRIVSMATDKVVSRLSGASGISAGLAALSLPPTIAPQPPRIVSQNVAVELAERAGKSHYPLVHVYCEKIVNDLKEKFRRFSGRVQMVVEIRQSQDRLDGIEESTGAYLDAVLNALTGIRGDWGDGMFFTGAYDVSIGAVKQGGKYFLQVAKVNFDIGVSRN